MSLLRWISQKDVVLRPYQEEALKIFLERKKGLICHPTALGKTFIAIEAIKRLNHPTAIFVPTKAILHQVWSRRLAEYGIPYGVYYGEEHRIERVTIFLYQSAIKHPEAIDKLSPKLIIFDEAHHLRAEKWSTLLEYVEKAEYALGLTATPPRDEKLLQALPVLHKLEYHEAKEWIAPVELHAIPAHLTPEERREYDQYTRIIKEVAYRLETTDPTVWSKLAMEGDETAKKGLHALAMRRLLLSRIKSKTDIFLKIIKENLNGKILVFSESIESIEQLKKLLDENSIPSQLYHSKRTRNENHQAMQLWSRNKTPILLSVTALEEGIDVPDATIGIFYASGTTRRKIIQRIGRLVRKTPNKIAKLYIIYAHNTIEEKAKEEAYRALKKQQNLTNYT